MDRDDELAKGPHCEYVCVRVFPLALSYLLPFSFLSHLADERETPGVTAAAPFFVRLRPCALHLGGRLTSLFLPPTRLRPPVLPHLPRRGVTPFPTPASTGELEMPGGRTANRQPGKRSRQLLFSEALCHQRDPPAEEHLLTPPSSMGDTMQDTTMDRILQETSAVGRKLEGMDSAMATLTAETKSMLLDIAGLQSQVTGLDQRVTSVETHIAFWVDRDQELLYFCSKLIDLEDRSRTDNVRFLGFPENIEDTDIHSYLR
ncbi:hypothetical protein NDU88_003526 [Pleurodeles waltl]|uniref:Uncharacterized protein n=1 Tax=Pleurodeles waltl TaxID=8319 RepID=A0AAV7SG92_PLEWA|nr:hypothetical protein NDU88_003526 [Pleurodeles waltl]